MCTTRRQVGALCVVPLGRGECARVRDMLEIYASSNRMLATCASAGTDDTAVLAVVSLFLAYSVTDLHVHGLVLARRLS